MTDEQICSATRHLWFKGKPTDSAYRVSIVRAALAAQPAQAECPDCHGSGEGIAMTYGRGPDDYEYPIQCPRCNGGGAVPAPVQAGEPVAVVESVDAGAESPVRLLWYVDFPNIAPKVKPGDKLYTYPAPPMGSQDRHGADPILAGLLFDFMGFLTTHETRWRFSTYDEASPGVYAIEQFAEKRGIELADADVRQWRSRAAMLATKQEPTT